MDELKSERRFKEVERKFEYLFLTRLNEDHPDLAKRVAGDIPGWKDWISKDTGSPELAEAMLKTMEYVTQKEIEQCIQGWVQEVTKSLTNTPDKIAFFILDASGSGSQRYFATEVYTRLSPELQKRVVMAGGDDMIHRMHIGSEDFDTFVHTDYWRFDDSANSGRQVKSMTLSDFAQMPSRFKKNAEENGKNEEYEAFLQKPDSWPVLHLRFMRTTNYGKKVILDEWNRFPRIYKEVPFVMKIDYKEDGIFPTINECSERLDLPWETMDQAPAYLYAQQHVIGWPVLGFFATKIQDNLPAGLMTSKLTPKGLKPLLEKSDITPPWKK